MGTIRIALIAFLAACSTSAAWAQYGLYGSPETLRLPQQEAIQAEGAPINYPATAMSAPQATPVPAQAPAYYYPPQSPYRYPAQSPAAAMYQQYQPGAQYCYPTPASRPPLRTAAVDSAPMVQSMPNPPGLAAMSVAPAPAPVPAPAYGPSYATPAPQGSGMMNQMLAEQNCGSRGGCDNGGGGVYRGAVGQFAPSACGPGAEGGLSGVCGQGCFCPWYASVSALVLGRSDSRRLWTTYEDGNLPNQLMNTQFPMEWKWGGEVCLGHRFCWDGVPCAIEGTYWTTQSFTGRKPAPSPAAT